MRAGWCVVAAAVALVQTPVAAAGLGRARSPSRLEDAFASGPDAVARLLVQADGRGAGDLRFPEPAAASDLDGDGTEDVVVAVAVLRGDGWYDGPWTIRAVRGSDGADLWTLRRDGTPATATADVDGDGRSEVVLLTTRWDAGASRTVYSVAASARMVQQTLELVDGRTGATRWTRVFTGIVEFASASGWPVVTAVHGLVTTRAVMPDGTGDGWPDVFVGVLDAVGASWNVQTRLDGLTLAGTTGVETARLTAHETRVEPAMVPVLDVSGDGLADVLVVEGAWPVETLAASSVRGERYWTTVFQDPVAQVVAWNVIGDGFPFTRIDVPGDLTGDGAADVVEYRSVYVRNGGEYLEGVDVLDGRTGGARWHWPAAGAFAEGAFVAGRIDGDAGLDLVGATYDPDSHELRLEARSGASSDPIWSRVATTDGSFAFNGGSPGDLDGDGLADAMVYAGGEFRAFASRDGGLLWAKPRREECCTDALWTDATGNGTADFFLGLGRPWGHAGPFALEVIEGSTFETAWSAAGEAPVGSVQRVLTVHGGGPPALVLVTRTQFEFGDAALYAYGPNGLLWAA
jgi:hypothetical protein